MKNILKFALVACVGLTLSSCLKDEDFDEDKVGLNPASIIDKPIIEIVNGGLGNFSKHVLSVDLGKAQDTNRFKVSYNYKGLTAPEDINVAFAYNAAALASYNAGSTAIQFEKLPDSTFSLPKNSVTIKKGQKISDAVDLIIFTAKVDPSKIYLLPISITSTSIGNSSISGNNAIIYFHIIGNALAGKYTVTGFRYNYSGSVSYGGPTGNNANIPAGFASSTNLAGVKTASAVDGQTITMSFSNLGFGTGFEYGYLFTGTNPAFTALNTSYNSAILSANAIKLSTTFNYIPPTATQKPAFRVITHYNNSAAGTGNDRIIDEYFVKQ